MTIEEIKDLIIFAKEQGFTSFKIECDQVLIEWTTGSEEKINRIDPPTKDLPQNNSIDNMIWGS